MPIQVRWPGRGITRVEVWRLLDLSGLTDSVRKSRNYMKAGFVYVNGNQVLSLKDTVPVDTPLTLAIRFPNGVEKAMEFTVVTREYYEGTPKRLS